MAGIKDYKNFVQTKTYAENSEWPVFPVLCLSHLTHNTRVLIPTVVMAYALDP